MQLSEPALLLNSKYLAAHFLTVNWLLNIFSKIMTHCPITVCTKIIGGKTQNIPEFFQRIPVYKTIAVKADSNGAK